MLFDNLIAGNYTPIREKRVDVAARQASVCRDILSLIIMKASEYMTKTQKIVSVLLSAITFNVSKNVRDEKADYEDIGSLMNDLRDNGQKQPVTLRKQGTVLTVVQGFRRTFATMELHKLYPDGYTVKGDDGKEILRKFDSVYAIVLEMTDDEEFVTMLDHGNTKPLSEVGLHIAMIRAFQNGKSEKWVVNTLRGSIDQRRPVSAGQAKANTEKVGLKLADIKPEAPSYNQRRVQAEEEVYFQFRRGFIQAVNNVFKSPNVVQHAYLSKARGEQSWPSDKEVSELLKLYESERVIDPINVSKLQPGSKFLETWNNMVTSKNADVAAGVRPKAMSMMPKAEIENVQQGCNSKLLKIVIGVILRTVDRVTMPDIDALFVAVENDPQHAAVIEKILQAAKVAPVENVEKVDSKVAEEAK